MLGGFMKRQFKFSVSFLAVLLILTATYAIAAKAEEIPVRFAVIGDRTGSCVPGIYEKIVAEVERMKPDFVITVGDHIEGYTDDTTLLKKEWEEYKSLISPLTMPIYFTPGNHDITNDTALPFYQRYIGKPYYSFDYRGIHFIVLDNSRYDSIAGMPKEQTEWIVNDLKKSRKATYTFVFVHKPFWFDYIAEGKTDLWHSLFVYYGVDAVFAGHNHLYYSAKYDNISYTAVGSSGGDCTPGPTGVDYHFTWVTADNKGISIAPIKIGSVLPWEEVTAPEVKLINKIERDGLDFEKSVLINDDLTASETAFVIKIKNLSSDQILEDTLNWNLTEGWSIDPKSLPIKVAKGESTKVKFKVKSKGKLYPVPTLTTRFSYAKDKTYPVKMTLPVARKAYCYKATKPPIIDGKISEPIWQKPISRLFAPNGGPIKIDSAYFYFAYDENNLYVAAHCKKSKIDSIFAKVTERDGAVYGEDCVGYFFCPDITKGIVYQIYFNPLGTVFDQKIKFRPDGQFDANRVWNGTYEVKTMKGTNFWSIEARIPLAQFETIAKPGQQWSLNFRRKQKRFNSSIDWQVPISYDPKMFGFLIMK
jgi:predicted phosphodiesterase